VPLQVAGPTALVANRQYFRPQPSSLARRHAQTALADLTAGAASIGKQTPTCRFVRTATLRHDFSVVVRAIEQDGGAAIWSKRWKFHREFLSQSGLWVGMLEIAARVCLSAVA
jgi:hypothetical protein